MTNFALVDFSNINPRSTNKADIRDTFERIEDICLEVSEQCSAEQLQVEDIPEFDVLLYDGWIDKGGGRTPRTHLVSALLGELRGTGKRIRIRPRLALNLMSQPSINLRGTYRSNGGSGKAQKMVDQMLVHDLHQLLSSEDDCSAIVISDDEDFVPGLIYASNNYENVYWATSRGSICNDSLISFTGLSVLRVGRWR